MDRLDLAKPHFTQADVLQILPRLAKNTLQNWKYRGILDTGDAGPGKGKRHLYTGHGVIMLSFMEKAVRLLRHDPSDASKLAPRVALCAQQLWDLEIDELLPNGMREIPPLAAGSNNEYRRGFIYTEDTGLRMELGRNDRKGSFSPRLYSVVAIDLINLNTLNQINRHIAGLGPVEVHIYSKFDEDLDLEMRRNTILSKIATLPVDGWDNYA